jgi:hypothetical protein
MLKKSQIATLAVGGSITVAIGVFYVVKDKTSFWLAKPLHCQVFQTADLRHPGQMEVCINGISHPYSAENGDVELDLTFMAAANERVQADATVWVADAIAGKSVDYTGEINYGRVRTYEHGLLVHEKSEKFSAWVNPVVPKDVHVPMWKWIHDLSSTFDRDKLSFDERFHAVLANFIHFFSVAAGALTTAYKMFRA